MISHVVVLLTTGNAVFSFHILNDIVLCGTDPRAACVVLTLEDQIRRLCAEIVSCEDDAAAIALTRELQFFLNQHIEEIRSRLKSIPQSQI